MRLNWWGNVTGVTTLSVLLASRVSADTSDIPGANGAYGYGHGMMWGGDYHGGFDMIFGALFMILILVGIVVAVVYVLRLTTGHGMAPMAGQNGDKAMDVLKDRFARGEIDAAEFAERKKLLQGS